MQKHPLISTEELVQLLKSRNRQAFSILYENYADALRAVIYRMVAHKTVTEDLLQDVFVKIWRYIASYDRSKGTFFTWMANIARRICIDHLRSKRHLQQIKEIETGYDYGEIITAILQPNYNITLIELHGHVQKLPVNQRQVIEMIYFRGFTYEEVAQILNQPPGTVKTHARAGLKKLRETYE